MMGLIGTLLGALIGALGSYFGAMRSLDKQIKYQNYLREKDKKDDRKVVVKVINKILREEIINNKIAIEQTKLYENLSYKYKTKKYIYNLKGKIKFDDYERIKFDLLKYTDVELVEEVIDLYSLFYILIRHSDIDEFEEKEYNQMLHLEYKLKKVLSSALFKDLFNLS
ncbi:hypothetical protein [Clostridium perfringens]|uniref:hypothetical protein n=1 Tax=Clostridium perfringens TaxID=1502 RepID=UPI0024BC2FC3|nr:hypothetical protein [Clostridium perfringens]EJT6166366.1 hypothetical protein [Clostridium perfringens]EJT6657832.1 hypothetical protein [Clostridium perfringens]ELC8437050.1 hypothetical protein [Clostridium perfringens]MDZ5022845.1 hypothetical protein [Clostridium perfringens]MDZ5069483.1 hypothetical protein [Clostridium perfringens]